LFADLTGDWITYTYLSTSTVLVFVLLGLGLGRSADTLRASSSTDPLTGLLNRRAFHERVVAELKRATRYGSPMSLLLIDVDGLKQINDAHGHSAGDTALRAVGQVLASCCRAEDVAARWGGDEFMLLAPGIGATDALTLAERIRESLRRPAGPTPAPSVSVGVTDLDRAGKAEPGVLYDSADAALYDAKTQGRDRAVVSQRPGPPPGDAH
jgi:diguanylate cyclase (GGDEF)-like protein